MKKGISTWAFSEATYAKRFALAKKHDFQGVELALDARGELSLTSDKDALAKILKIIKKIFQSSTPNPPILGVKRKSYLKYVKYAHKRRVRFST